MVTPRPTEKRDAALDLAGQGRRVHPVKAGTKVPHLGNWQNRATVDPSKIATWWARYRNANVGVATGAESDLVIIDVDNGQAGEADLAALVAELGPLPETRAAGTPGEAAKGKAPGRQLWFRHPGGHVGNSTGELAPSIDVKGDGGQVLAPPSERPDGAYSWINDGPVLELPPTWAARLRSAPRPAAVEAGPVELAPPGAADHYSMAALEGEKARMAATTTGRNDQLNKSAHNLGQLAHEGRIAPDVIAAELEATALELGYHVGHNDSPEQVRRTIASGLEAGLQHPRPDPAEVDTETAPEFWTAREALVRVRDFARARRASPWATLGAALARVVVATSPEVTLPPLVGGPASLNLFVGLVGPSGVGKGAAQGAAVDAVHVGNLDLAGPGSGEGIAHLFAYWDSKAKEVMRTRDAVLLEAHEVDTLAAVSQRKSATILAELRKVWMGEPLGFAYADPTKRLQLAAHSYRLSLVVGIQPELGGTLLDDADAGTPQRFLWLPATDQDAPDRAPPAPDPWAWRPPCHSGQVELEVCSTARAAIDTDRLVRLRAGRSDLDAHALLARLKVAAALALVATRLEVTDEDWTLAGMVMAVSDATRAAVQRRLAERAGDRNRARGEAEAQRSIVVHERVEDAALERVTARLVAKLQAHNRDDGWLAHADLRRLVAYRDRQYFEQAIDQAEERRLLEVDHADHGGRYRARR
jgi:hypothetical protein